jgi:hypothetical protein
VWTRSRKGSGWNQEVHGDVNGQILLAVKTPTLLRVPTELAPEPSSAISSIIEDSWGKMG